MSTSTSPQTQCPNCAKFLKLKSDSLFGRKTNCPKCKEKFEIKPLRQRSARGSSSKTKQSKIATQSFSADETANWDDFSELEQPSFPVQVVLQDQGKRRKRTTVWQYASDSETENVFFTHRMLLREEKPKRKKKKKRRPTGPSGFQQFWPGARVVWQGSAGCRHLGAHHFCSQN
ncbi:MAG: hypothetical protein R3C11_13450 [Planctomycetaceae bacterium]